MAGSIPRVLTAAWGLTPSVREKCRRDHQGPKKGSEFNLQGQSSIGGVEAPSPSDVVVSKEGTLL